MENRTVKHTRYFCSFQGCTAAYNKQWKLDAHVCKHTGVKPHTCGHQGCGKSFSSPYHLARHELIHTGDKPFPCTVEGCAEAFTTNSNRQRHISQLHGERKYVCTYGTCGLEFRKKGQLKFHMCEQHSTSLLYLCTFEGCAMRFRFPSILKRHEKVHRGYPCGEPGCAFTGKTWTDYLAHRREQHRTRHGCDQCTKTFSDQWKLRQHQRVHGETRSVLRCPREGCERTFTTSFNLQSHIGSFHEEQRPHTCPHPGCGRSFAMKQSLIRHGVIHDPERKKIRKTRRKRSMASRLSGLKDPKTSSRPSPDPNPPASSAAMGNPDLVQTPGPSKDREPVLILHPCADSDPVQHPGLVLHLRPDPPPGQTPAQREPGQSPGFSLNDDPAPDPVRDSVELVSLLQDTSLLCAANAETLEQISSGLTAPLTV
uniref:Transcription factor IIIA n=1 Tax=Neogobius melanostomus TaxID=47308 RepID=A0A8C6UAH5_9GOBI